MSICENIKHIRHSIDEAAKRAGRNPDDIKLIAVSKTRPASEVAEALECGQYAFGENRPQELAGKADELHSHNIQWHLIGQLQKNKVRHIIDKAALIHSVDSLALAAEIDKRAAAAGKRQNILIQVNISGEASKSGIAADEAESICRQISVMKNVHIIGLMTISVNGYTYSENKELFKKLADLASEIGKKNIENVSMKELSMGMSHDYEAAIEAGATMIRIGTAIFGRRDTANI